MDNLSETWVTAPKRPAADGPKDACLVHIYPTGPAMGARYPLTVAGVVVGRGDDSTIQIQDHSVSRRHARILPTANGFQVTDLHSTNGTFVNDQRVSGRAVLSPGDRLRVGRVELSVRKAES